MNQGRTVFSQLISFLPYRESLRDIEACLGSLQGKLYHLGFRGKVARSTLADANESRDSRIFADFAQRLIATARGLYVREPMGVDLEQSLYALDSTTIDLCLALFPWARFRRRKAAVKMHTLLLVAIVRQRLGIEASLYQILQILSLTLFEKTPISCALQAIDGDANFAENANQLILFDF